MPKNAFQKRKKHVRYLRRRCNLIPNSQRQSTLINRIHLYPDRLRSSSVRKTELTLHPSYQTYSHTSYQLRYRCHLESDVDHDCFINNLIRKKSSVLTRCRSLCSLWRGDLLRGLCLTCRRALTADSMHKSSRLLFLEPWWSGYQLC